MESGLLLGGTLGAAEDLAGIFEEALSLVREREGIYGDGWKTEDTLEEHCQNVVRKARAVNTMSKFHGTISLPVREQVLDIINYSAIVAKKLGDFRIKLGLDCPTNWLLLLQPLSDFAWILAYKAAEDREYLEFYKGYSGPKYINSRYLGRPFRDDLEKSEEITGVLELKGVVGRCTAPVELATTMEVFEEVNGDFVIAADWFRDFERTSREYEVYVDAFGKEKVIGVVQGDNKKEILKCSEIYGENVALPYDIGSKWEDPYWLKMARRGIAVSLLPDKKVHLLGMTSLEELSWYSSSMNVVSVNTGTPVKAGLEGHSIHETGDKIFSSMMQMGHYEPTLDLISKVLENVKLVKLALSGGKG